jgi:hypothetical protein
MKILIKESQYKVLLEQGFEMMEPSPITKAYNEIISGAKYWMGTDKTKILKAFDYIIDVQDFKTLISMFKDKRTGYGSFEEMINKEYDRLDFKDIIKLKDKLYSIGVILNFISGKNIAGNPIFLEGVKISYVNKTPIKSLQLVPKECSSKWQPQLEKAKNYWIQWLSSPITRVKFLNNWQKVEKNMTLAEVGNIFKKYIDSLKFLKLYYFDSKLIPKESNSYAFVNKFEPEKIFVNCSQNDEDPYGTLIHEIQHMLYNIKPLNPEVQIANVFVDSNTKKSTPKTFFDSKQKTFFYDDEEAFNPTEIAKLDSTSTQIGVPSESLGEILRKAKNKEKEKPGYVCRETEKMSNITSIRSLFGVKTGQNITKKMVLPYIKGEKNHTDVDWILFCWALRGFSDLNGMLNKMNQLAYQKTNQNNNSNTRTV